MGVWGFPHPHTQTPILPYMLESRAVRSDELDIFLEHLCEAFGLPYAAARDLFYRDPSFQIENKRVLADGGRILCCLTVSEARMWIGTAGVPVAGIASVATLRGERRKGYASRLLEDTLTRLRAQGIPLVALIPYDYAFYRRLGWEMASSQLRLVTAPDQIPRFADARYVRPALPTDRPDVERLHAEATASRTGACLRDGKRWAVLFEHSKARIVYKRRALDGYAIYEVSEPGEKPRRVRVMELYARTDAARRGLTAYLADACADAEVIEYIGGWHEIEESGLFGTLCGEGCASPPRVERLPGAMFRVVDFCKALHALAPNFRGFEGQVTLTADDTIGERSTCGSVTVEGDGLDVAVRPALDTDGGRKQIRGNVRAWAQALTGHYSLRDLISLHRLRAFSDAAAQTAGSLFPRRDPFLPPLDYF